MSKFTQEDLLNAIGLKVGDKIDVRHYGIGVISEEQFIGIVIKWCDGRSNCWRINDLIGTEYSVITPPKYTLTETEKHIVLAIDEKFKTLYKLGNDSVVLYTVGGERHYLTVFGEIFGSIPLNNYVSLDELKEIAQK